ncbi:MAG: NAD(P)-dependent glycerol-3-phosphate dehydrogenase [Actinomycetota bacterium]|nr:NAD(P)-dependent glycerol-3-phosphate dehydrogenase [Actinomycetota bacterium]
MVQRVAVIGAGSWGTTVAAISSLRARTVLWARSKKLADEIDLEHRNGDYLANHRLPEALHATASLDEALDGSELVLMAVPSHGFRRVLTEARPAITAGTPIISLAKGVEQGSLKRMTEVISEVAPGCPAGVVTGPNFAQEISAGLPAATVVALKEESVAAEVQELLCTEFLRVYTNPDVVGCEVAGAIKNVIAIAAGMADGMHLGDNARAALITRGLHEMARLGVVLGGQPLTFSGLTGLGDLVATCVSGHSRNRYVGEELGKGRDIDEIVPEMIMVAEGVNSSPAVLELAGRVGVEMPIAEQVVAVLHHGRSAAEAVSSLMRREAKPELEGLTSQDGSSGPVSSER